VVEAGIKSAFSYEAFKEVFNCIAEGTVKTCKCLRTHFVSPNISALASLCMPIRVSSAAALALPADSPNDQILYSVDVAIDLTASQIEQ